MSVRNPIVAVFLCILSITPLPLLAQDGELLVRVTDQNGKALADATVSVIARDGESTGMLSDGNGVALFPEVSQGLYRVEVEKAGFIGAVEPDARAIRDRTVPVDIVLVADVDGTLEEVFVEASALKAVGTGPVSTSFVDREQLRTAAGSGGDVFRALDGLPGLFSVGEFSNYTVRGLGPRDNLVLVDGFPYKSVVHFDESLGEREDINGGGRYSIFSPNFIESAEYTPGGWGAAEGGRNSSLLLMNIPEGNPSPYASARLDIGGVEFVYDGPTGIHQDTSMILTLRHYDFGAFFEMIGEEDIGDPVMTDFNVKTHTQLNDNNELEFLLLYNPEEYGRDVENVLASDDLQDRELINTDQDAWLLGTTLRNRFGDNMTWENRFYYTFWEKAGSEGEAFPFTDPEILPPEQVEVREDILMVSEKDAEIGWRSDLTVDNSLGRFTTGVRVASLDLEYSKVLDGDWIRYEYDTDDSRPDESQNYIVLTPEQTDAFYEESDLYYAAYAEQAFEFDRWSVSTGLRYDFDGFNDEGYTSPRIAADFRLGQNTRLSATAGLFYQAPRVIDRAANVSNADLGWEELAHVSIGIEHMLSSSWTVIAEAYYRQLDDLIIEADAVTGVTANTGEGESYGLDVVLNGSFGSGWRTNLAYSYNDTQLNDNDGAGDYPSDNNYEHLLSLGVSWEINDRWQIGARWDYASGRPFDDFVIYDDVLADLGGPTRYSREFTTHNTLRGSSFNTLDIRVDYRVPLGSFDFVAFLDLLNATGSTTTDELEFDPASGILYEEDGEVFPFIGLILEKSW
jgi:hypothetical protein